MKAKIFCLSLLASLFFMAGCGEDDDGTEPTPNGDSTKISPSWTFTEIPELKFAEISRNGKWAIVASDYRMALLDLKNKAELYEVATSESDLDYVVQVSISDQGYALVVSANGIGVISATQGLIANFSEVYIGQARYYVGGYPSMIAPSGVSYYVHGNMKFSLPDNLVWLNTTDSPNYDFSNELDLSGDGSLIASASGVYGKLVLLDGSGNILWKSSIANDAIRNVDISIDGSTIAIGDLSEIDVYASNSPAPIIRWPHNSYYAIVAVSKNGSVITGGTSHGKLVIFKNGSETPNIYDKPDGQVNDIAISDDGKIIVLATDFGGLEIYNDLGKLKYQHKGQYEGIVSCVSISSDGKNVGCIFQNKFHLYALP